MQAEDTIRNLTEQGNYRNKRVSLKGMLMHTLGSNPSRETTVDTIADDKISQILEITGGTMVEEVNPKTGLKEKYFKGPKGQYLTWGNYKGIQQAVNDVFLVGGNPVLRGKQRLREMEKFGTKGLEEPRLRQQYETLKKNVNDPRWQLAQLQKVQDLSIQQLSKYRQMGKQTPSLDIKVEKRQKQINGLIQTIAAGAAQAGKEKIERIKQKGKDDSGKKRSALQKDAMRQVAIKLGYDNALDWERDKEVEYEELLGKVSRLEKTGRYKNDPIGLANAAFGNADPAGIRQSINELLRQ